MREESFNENKADSFAHEFHEGEIDFWIEFGGGGHESEYMISMPQFGHRDFAPCNKVAVSLQEKLGNEWNVVSRGPRIEIVNKNIYGFREDDKIEQAVKEAIKENITFIAERKKVLEE